MTEAANAATLTAGTVAVDVPHIAGNYVPGAGCYHGAGRRRRRDDAAPTEYASSLVFTTRQHSPSGHLDGRRRRLGAHSRSGMSSPEISETGHTGPDMMDFGNKRALVRCAELGLW